MVFCHLRNLWRATTSRDLSSACLVWWSLPPLCTIKSPLPSHAWCWEGSGSAPCLSGAEPEKSEGWDEVTMMAVAAGRSAKDKQGFHGVFALFFEAYPGCGNWCQEKCRGVVCGMPMIWL